MGVSLSSNMSTILSSVSTAVESTATVNQNADNSCAAENSLSGCDITVLGNFSLSSGCSLVNTVTQIGSVSNSTQMNTDVATALTQDATSSTGFLGIGLSSAVNSAFTSSSVTNTVTSISETSMSEVNEASTSNTLEDCTLTVGGDIDISSLNDLSLTGSQTGSTESFQDVATTVDNEVTQSAAATVEGVNSCLAIIAVVIVIAMVIAAVLKMMRAKSSSPSPEAVSGGALTVDFIYNTVGALIVAGCLYGVSLNALANRIPCNNNSQCISNDWWISSYKCSCTDHMTCGLNEPNHTPIADVNLPLMMFAPMENSTINTNTAYLRKMTVRSICGMDISNPEANNQGYNLQNYILLRKQVLDSGVLLVDKLYAALYDFIRLHFTAQNSNNAISDDYTAIIDPFYEDSDPESYTPPCNAALASMLLPLQPYYMSESDANNYSNPLTATYTDGTCPSSTSLLKVNALQKSRKQYPHKKKLFSNMSRNMPNKIRLTDDEEEIETENAANGLGSINISQRLCFSEGIASDGSTAVTFSRQTPDPSSATVCPTGTSEIWSANKMHTRLFMHKAFDSVDNYTTYLTAAQNDGGGLLNLPAVNQTIGDITLNLNLGTINQDWYAYLPYGQLTAGTNLSNAGFTIVTEPFDFNFWGDENFPSSELNSYMAGSFGSKNNTDPPYPAYTGAGWWPNDDNRASNSGWVTMGNTNYSDYNKMWYAGNDETRLALNNDFDGASCINTGIGRCDTEGGSRYDGNNVVSFRMGIDNGGGTSGTGTQVGLMCQTFGPNVEDADGDLQNQATRFAALNPYTSTNTLPSNYNDCTFYDKNNIGTTDGDKFCAHASGFSTRPGPYPWIGSMTAGSYNDTASNLSMSDIVNNSGNLTSFDFLKNTALNTGPIGGGIGNCQVIADDNALTRVCDASALYNCYNPAVCAAMGGSWVVDRAGVDPSACSDGFDVNFSSTGKDCYPGQCMNSDLVCSSTSCSACLSEDACPTEDNKCKWTGTMCIQGCLPSSGLCGACISESECESPCYWNSDNKTCTYGPPQCSSSTEDLDCCGSISSGQNYYICRIPDAFCSTGVSSSSSSSDEQPMNCSPGVFQPDLSESANGFDTTYTSGDTVPDNILVCDASTSAFSNVYTVNCKQDGSNCYGNSDSVGLFETLKIPSKVECFFTDDPATGPTNSGTNTLPHFYVALENSQYELFDDTNFDNENGRIMWYFINRIFSWILMLSTSAEKQTYLTSVLGLSTLLNNQGMNSDTNVPYLPLDVSQGDIFTQVTNQCNSMSGNPFARTQPLMFVDNDENFFFATLEDIYNNRVPQFNSDDYLRQINQFVWSSTDTSSGFSTNLFTFVKEGVGSGFSSTSISDVVSSLSNYTGTLVGSTGNCETLFNNDIVIYGGISVASLIVLLMIVLWGLELKKYF